MATKCGQLQWRIAVRVLGINICSGVNQHLCETCLAVPCYIVQCRWGLLLAELGERANFIRAVPDQAMIRQQRDTIRLARLAHIGMSSDREIIGE